MSKSTCTNSPKASSGQKILGIRNKEKKKKEYFYFSLSTPYTAEI